MSSQPELSLQFRPVRSLLDEWRRRDADKPAIVDLDQEGRSISWGNLAVEADGVGRFLADRGVKPGDKVALLSGIAAE